MRTAQTVLAALALVLALACAAPAAAQASADSGKLRIHVHPKQAYVFVDGKAIHKGSQKIDLDAGKHTIDVQNYGYLPKTQVSDITAGKTTHLRVDLQPSGEKVDGPFADIELKGDRRAAVLLNGQDPKFFVGHLDEFNWNWLWHQRLLVKPGTYQISVKREGNQIWSGPVTARAGERVTVYLNRDGATKTKDWKQGLTMAPQDRFRAGILNSTVTIAPVTDTLTAQSPAVGCGQGTTLNWSSTNAVDTSISGIGEVAGQGDRSVSPLHKTTYVLTARGPGGEATQSVTIDVDAKPVATLTLSQPEVHYHKIGDRVVQQDSATLKWSATNATSATIEPLNIDQLSGSRTITADPEQSSIGPVDQSRTYSIAAKNACGGTTTATATLRVVGSIDPPPSETLASVFYPTAYPTRQHPKVGLVASEKTTLDDVAQRFKDFESYENKASLVVNGYADVRGSRAYNMALSKRRAMLMRDYLIAKGIPADDIRIQAEGKDKQLDRKAVVALEVKDHLGTDKWMTKDERSTWLAFNRRADLVLEPTGQKSQLLYPVADKDARIVWQRREPALKRVETASKSSTSSEQASASRRPGN